MGSPGKAKPDIRVYRVIELLDRFVVLTWTDDNQGKIFDRKCRNNLENERFSPILSPELRAKPHGNTEKDIKEELMEQNTWIERGIENIFKFPKSKMIKITLKSSVSQKASSYALLAFNVSIPEP